MEIESLLCDEVWLMSPRLRENDFSNVDSHVAGSFYSCKEDCEESFGIFLSKETSYMPESGYVEYIKSNNLIRKARFNAICWFSKTARRMNLSLGTVFASVNCLDRFISVTKCQGWKYWMFELLSIACLTVSSKFNETTTLMVDEFQVEGLDQCCDSSQIQRMELTLLKDLGWRINPTTPHSYIKLLIQSIDANKTLVEELTSRVTDLLLNAVLDLDFLEFRPCTMAISALSCISEELLPSASSSSLVNFDAFLPRDQKDHLVKCQDMLKKQLMGPCTILTSGSYYHSPSSPVTVLNVEWCDLYDCRIDASLLKMPAIDTNFISTKKRKREAVKSEIRILNI